MLYPYKNCNSYYGVWAIEVAPLDESYEEKNYTIDLIVDWHSNSCSTSVFEPKMDMLFFFKEETAETRMFCYFIREPDSGDFNLIQNDCESSSNVFVSAIMGGTVAFGALIPGIFYDFQSNWEIWKTNEEDEWQHHSLKENEYSILVNPQGKLVEVKYKIGDLSKIRVKERLQIMD